VKLDRAKRGYEDLKKKKFPERGWGYRKRVTEKRGRELKRRSSA